MLLEDTIINFIDLTEPNILSFLNFAQSVDQLPQAQNEDFAMRISLSNEIKIQRRKTYDIFAMLA